MSQMQPPTQSQQSGQFTDAQQPQHGSQGGKQSQQMHQQPPQQPQQQSQGLQQQQPQQGAATGNTGRLVPTQNYLPQQVRTTSIAALNQCLADLQSTLLQVKSAHWNVRGMHFYQFHELFEDVAEELEEHVDTVAERATALGGQAFGTAPVVAQQSTVPQLQPTTTDGTALLQQVATTLAALDATIYDQINQVSEQGDLDTADLLNEVSRTVSKSLWLVESHLQGQSGAGAGGQQAAGVQSQGF